ncbi:MAG: alpha/beta hydrolase [Bacteroidota bacterium]
MKSFKLLILFVFLFYSNGQSQVLDTMMKVDNHLLHFKIIEGEGIPILFEAGNGDDGSVWEPILKKIHEETGATLITYDRAGLGKSSIDTTNISFTREIKNLKLALARLGYQKKFFLVAHSFGSFYASEFALINKGNIKGAVFIDVATPCGLNVEYATRIEEAISQENWALLNEYKTGLFYVLKEFPEISKYMAKRFISNSIPLTVVAAGVRNPTKEIGETEQDMINMTNCLKAFGSLPNHQYIPVPKAGHKVWVQSPEIVINEIAALYKQVSKTKQ